jgi:hypothetical protein
MPGVYQGDFLRIQRKKVRKSLQIYYDLKDLPRRRHAVLLPVEVLSHDDVSAESTTISDTTSLAESGGFAADEGTGDTVSKPCAWTAIFLVMGILGDPSLLASSK